MICQRNEVNQVKTNEQETGGGWSRAYINIKDLLIFYFRMGYKNNNDGRKGPCKLNLGLLYGPTFILLH